MTISTPDRAVRRALTFTPMETDWRLLVEAAVHAEEAGYEAVVIPEGWGLDASIVLTHIAQRTRRIRLVSGILSIWGRSAATMAMTAATLDDISDGRFTLGVGASTPVLAEQLHGVAFDQPARHLEATVATVRALLNGKRLAGLDGQPGLRLGLDARPGLPIWVAGLGPRATATAVGFADGWFPVMIPRSRIRALSEAADPDGRSVCQLATGPLACISSAERDGRSSAEQLLGWYLTGMGRLYGDLVAANGFADEISAVRTANPSPRPGAIVWPRAADVLLGELTAHGDAAAVGAQLRRWDRYCDVVTVASGPAPADELHQLIDACAPDQALDAPAKAPVVPATT